jgi:hypothetical protein
MGRPKNQADYAWVAEQLTKLKAIQGDGTVAFTHCFNEVYYEDLITLLETHHTFPSDIPDVECRRIVGEAIREAARTGDITEKSLKGKILKYVNAFTERPASDFVMLTSLSIARPKNLGRIIFDDARFMFSHSLPVAFSRANIDRFKERTPDNDLPPEFTTVRVQVQARSDFEALDKALESMDFLRGIWNYRLNRGISSRWHSGLIKPINSIRLGPVHTLHLTTGQPATPLFWYEPLYPVVTKPEVLKKWDEVKKEERNIRKAIRKSHYADFLKAMFVRYARSLDSSDHDSSFLKLWSLLEFITVISDTDNYAEVIRRTLSLSGNEEYDCGEMLASTRANPPVVRKR